MKKPRYRILFGWDGKEVFLPRYSTLVWAQVEFIDGKPMFVLFAEFIEIPDGWLEDQLDGIVPKN